MMPEDWSHYDDYRKTDSILKFLLQITAAIILVAIGTFLWVQFQKPKPDGWVELALGLALTSLFWGIGLIAMMGDFNFLDCEDKYKLEWNKTSEILKAREKRRREIKPVIYLDYICPICREAIGKESFEMCLKCQTPHHAECWDYNEGNCSIFGCNPIRRPKMGEIGYR